MIHKSVALIDIPTLILVSHKHTKLAFETQRKDLTTHLFGLVIEDPHIL